MTGEGWGHVTAPNTTSGSFEPDSAYAWWRLAASLALSTIGGVGLWSSVVVLPTIEADETQMRQLLQNLIGNALKFAKPDRKPRIHVDGQVISASESSSRTDLCRLTIADNGIGFDNQYKDQIFTIFQRLHGRGEYEGTGIGLATCRKIVERHGGEIDADGRPDEGTTFTVTLPVTQS